MTLLLLVLLGGAVGATLRYLTDRALTGGFPWGTLTVNVVASLGLGMLTGAASALPPEWYALLGTGLAGALSTYSTFGYETVRLIRDGAHRRAFRNVVANLTATLSAAAAGLWLGTTLIG